jgi:hypothetical protein
MTRTHTKLRPVVSYTLDCDPLPGKATQIPRMIPISFSETQLDKVIVAARSLPWNPATPSCA